MSESNLSLYYILYTIYMAYTADYYDMFFFNTIELARAGLMYKNVWHKNFWKAILKIYRVGDGNKFSVIIFESTFWLHSLKRPN